MSNEAVHSLFFLFRTTLIFIYILFFLPPQLALVGVVAMAAAQEDDFLVIDGEVDDNDIDPDRLEKLEEDGTVKALLKGLLSQDR